LLDNEVSIPSSVDDTWLDYSSSIKQLLIKLIILSCNHDLKSWEMALRVWYHLGILYFIPGFGSLKEPGGCSAYLAKSFKSGLCSLISLSMNLRLGRFVLLSSSHACNISLQNILTSDIAFPKSSWTLVQK
jgi:hypothetical protein